MAIVVSMVACMGSVLFASHVEEVGTLMGSFSWTWRLSLLGDMESSSFFREIGYSLSSAEVRVFFGFRVFIYPV